MAWLSVGQKLRQNMGALPAGFSMMIAVGLCFIAGFSMSLELFLGAVPFGVAGLVGDGVERSVDDRSLDAVRRERHVSDPRRPPRLPGSGPGVQ